MRPLEQRSIGESAAPASLTAVPEIPRLVIQAGRRGIAFSGLRTLWRDAYRQRELLFFLTLRDLKLRYKQTALGVIWTILQPLITTGIFSFVFGKFAGIPSGDVPYPLFCLAALLAWNYFANTLSRGTTSLVGNGFLLSKIYVPRVLVPASALLPAMVDLVIGFVVWLGLAAYYGFTPSWTLIYKLPLMLALNVVFVFGLSLGLGALNVRFRDITNVLPFVTQALMFLTPVIYPASIISEKWRWAYRLNPLVPLVDGFRSALLGTPLPPLGLTAGFALLALVAGLTIFHRLESRFADLL